MQESQGSRSVPLSFTTFGIGALLGVVGGLIAGLIAGSRDHDVTTTLIAGPGAARNWVALPFFGGAAVYFIRVIAAGFHRDDAWRAVVLFLAALAIGDVNGAATGLGIAILAPAIMSLRRQDAPPAES